MQFWHYLAIRLVQAFIVVMFVVTIVFFVSRTIGNPEVFLVPTMSASQEDIDRIREHLGLDKPLIVQYGAFLLDMAQGDLGISFRGGGGKQRQVSPGVHGAKRQCPQPDECHH